MAFAKRIINLQFTLGQGDFGTAGQNTVLLEGLRCSANLVRGGNLLWVADVQIWGMSLDLMNKLTVTQKSYFQEYRRNDLFIFAGDSANTPSMCFGGTVREAWADGRNQPDVVFHVSADTGQFPLSKPIAPTSYSGSVDAAMVLAGLAQQIGYSFENSGVTGQLENPYKPGSVRSQIESVCADVHAQFDIDDRTKVLAVWPNNKARNGAVVLVSPDTGLVGYPAFTQGGVQFTTIYNPSLDFGRKVRIESAFTAANGEWRISAMSHRLESQIPNGQWFTDVECSFLDNKA
ncbi:hypothetical protein F1640_14900 [Novosphingobium sp. NBM11]|uniref:baseplate hub protein n=1 Tax=Novosphingobium sp. NBM11 TaxID=2596914 RepID=UPI0018921B58|nr:hypothetical protein [Novosphingobium sp. NBM11]MBF5091275.1 hypothetical protein [Novosphingobium sp. NBM11]